MHWAVTKFDLHHRALSNGKVQDCVEDTNQRMRLRFAGAFQLEFLRVVTEFDINFQ